MYKISAPCGKEEGLGKRRDGGLGTRVPLASQKSITVNEESKIRQSYTHHTCSSSPTAQPNANVILHDSSQVVQVYTCWKSSDKAEFDLHSLNAKL